MRAPASLFPDPAAARAGAGARPRRLSVEGGGDETRGARGRARRRLGRRDRVRRRRSRRCVRAVPCAPQAGPAARAAAAAWSPGRGCATSSCATTCSTTSASTPFHPRELEARVKHLFWRTGRGTRPELVEYGDLMLNLETYQAAFAGRPLDLTYMEYELLKFLAVAPRQGVHPRDAALPRVGLRVLRRRAHRRRPHPTSAGQARRGARQPDPDGPVGRLPLRPEPLERLSTPDSARETGR